MPNRWVREDAIESDSVNAASWQCEVFWRRLLNRCDDFGRFTANLTLLRTKIFPLQMDKVSEVDVARLLSECESVGLLFAYKGPDGKPYLVLNKFEKGRAKNSKYPDPPPEVCARMQAFVYKCTHAKTNAPTSDPDPDPDPDSATDPERGAHAAEPVIPTVDEIFVACPLGAGIPRDYCQHYHEENTIRNRWVKGGQLIQWRLDIPKWWAKDRATWFQRNGAKPKPSDITKPKSKVL